MQQRNLAVRIAAAAISLFRRPNASIERGHAAARARFDTRKWTPELLKHLEWRRFQELCAAYVEAAGIDTAAVVVRCKPWDAYRVGIKPVREVHAAMAAAGASQGMLVSSGRFTPEAVAFAAKENIQLVDGAELLEKIAALAPEQSAALLKLATQGDFLTPSCPACEVKMAPRRSTQGGRKFWGCTNYPRCKQTLSATG
jgi:restriction system protein